MDFFDKYNDFESFVFDTSILSEEFFKYNYTEYYFKKINDHYDKNKIIKARRDSLLNITLDIEEIYLDKCDTDDNVLYNIFKLTNNNLIFTKKNSEIINFILNIYLYQEKMKHLIKYGVLLKTNYDEFIYRNEKKLIDEKKYACNIELNDYLIKKINKIINKYQVVFDISNKEDITNSIVYYKDKKYSDVMNLIFEYALCFEYLELTEFCHNEKTAYSLMINHTLFNHKRTKTYKYEEYHYDLKINFDVYDYLVDKYTMNVFEKVFFSDIYKLYVLREEYNNFLIDKDLININNKNIIKLENYCSYSNKLKIGKTITDFSLMYDFDVQKNMDFNDLIKDYDDNFHFKIDPKLLEIDVNIKSVLNKSFDCIKNLILYESININNILQFIKNGMSLYELSVFLNNKKYDPLFLDEIFSKINIYNFIKIINDQDGDFVNINTHNFIYHKLIVEMDDEYFQYIEQYIELNSYQNNTIIFQYIKKYTDIFRKYFSYEKRKKSIILVLLNEYSFSDCELENLIKNNPEMANDIYYTQTEYTYNFFDKYLSNNYTFRYITERENKADRQIKGNGMMIYNLYCNVSSTNDKETMMKNYNVRKINKYIKNTK